MTNTLKTALLTISALAIAAASATLLIWWLLGGKACRSNLHTENPTVEAMYRFEDYNGEHLTHAKSIGIAPLDSVDQIGKEKVHLLKLRTCRHYRIAQLSYSHLYLIPEASQLLEDIGRNFQQRLRSSGYHPHRIVVTSLLRTKADIVRLRKVNINSVVNSAHLYGTTFDISYANFAPWLGRGKVSSKDELARALGEALQELRSRGRCCIKYEHSTNCYHITVCGNKS